MKKWIFTITINDTMLQECQSQSSINIRQRSSILVSKDCECYIELVPNIL